MRTPLRCLALMALATFLLVGGQTGFCALLGSLDVDHHHHAAEHSHHASSACGKDADDCDEPTLPCRESVDHDGKDLTALVPDSPLPISSPLAGELPAPEIDFSISNSPKLAPALSMIRDAVRGSPPTRPALLCRFRV